MAENLSTEEEHLKKVYALEELGITPGQTPNQAVVNGLLALLERVRILENQIKKV